MGDLKPKRRFWTSAECDYLVAMYATHTIEEQVVHLVGRTRAAVVLKRGDLIREGRVDISQRYSYPHFTPDQIEEIQRLVREGWSTRAIARTMKRVETVIVTALNDHCATTMTALRADSLVYSLQGFARMMGITAATARRWYNNGFLGPHRQRRKQDVIRLVETDIVTFLENRNHWPRWHPSAMTDPVWRVRAEQIRAAAGGYWTTAPQIAKQHYCCPMTALRHLQLLRIPFLRIRRTFFYWSTDVEGIHFDY